MVDAIHKNGNIKIVKKNVRIACQKVCKQGSDDIKAYIKLHPCIIATVV